MNCHRCQRLLPAHLDGRSAGGARERLEAHLSGCARCQQALHVLEGARRVLAAEGPAEPPADLAHRAVRAALAAAAADASGPSFVDRWIPVAWRALTTASLAAVGLVIVALSSSPAPVRENDASDPVARVAPFAPEPDEIAGALLAIAGEGS